MSKLTTINYEHENLKFKYDVSIDKIGFFTTTIPKEVSEKLMEIGVKLTTNRRHNPGYFIAESLKELEKKVKETADKYSKKELISEKIIVRYAVDTLCSYCRSENGNIYPNGGLEEKAEGHDKGYHWINGTKDDFYSKGSYSFDVAFELKKLKIWKFPNDEESKEYLRLEDLDIGDDELLNWLNGLCHIYVPSNSPNVKEIDYSDEVGMLFKKMVFFIFNINENIRSIFGDKFDLEKIKNLSSIKLLES